MPRVLLRPANEDFPRVAFDEELGPSWRLIRADMLRICPQVDEDLPLLGLAIDEDSPAAWRPALPWAMRAPVYQDEDVPVLHGVYEDDVWVRGVPPRREWQWWPPPPDGDWTPVPPGTVPGRAGLLLASQNREGLALQRVAAMQLNLAASGRLALALVRFGPSQLSLSVVGQFSLSLTRSG